MGSWQLDIKKLEQITPNISILHDKKWKLKPFNGYLLTVSINSNNNSLSKKILQQY